VGTFLAEGYLSSATADGLARDGARAAAATSDLAWDSGRVRYLGGVFLPADQTCLLMFEASAAEHVGRACQRAGLPCERVTPALITGRAPACDASGASVCR
jgi:hypothetical protein